MIIYLAGNMPGRVNQATDLVKKEIGSFWLLSYFYYITDVTVKDLFDYWKSV